MKPLRIAYLIGILAAIAYRVSRTKEKPIQAHYTDKIKVSHTAYQDGSTVEHNGDMPKPSVKNYGELMKAAVMNEVREGGICYSEMSALEQAKKILKIK